MRPIALGLFTCALLQGCASAPQPEATSSGPAFRPVAVAVTDAVESDGDAADDAAIYVHPKDPSKSLILGTNKRGGLIVYDLTGRTVSAASPDSRPNNVHVAYDVPTPSGQRWDLAVAGCRNPEALGLKFWRIDPEGGLTDVTRGGTDRVLNGSEPYGSAVYRSPVSGRRYVLVNGKSGEIEQREIRVTPAGEVHSELVRKHKLPSQVEGMCADDEMAYVYVSEEAVGLWRFPAEPEDPSPPVLIARVGEHGLTADVEGVTIYRGTGRTGYLIVSSQGSNDFKVYDRAPPHRFRGTIRPRGTERFPAPRGTDGLVAESSALGARFPSGVLVVQDGAEPPRRQDFKVYSWVDLEKAGLPEVTPAPSPRLPPKDLRLQPPG